MTLRVQRKRQASSGRGRSVDVPLVLGCRGAQSDHVNALREQAGLKVHLLHVGDSTPAATRRCVSDLCIGLNLNGFFYGEMPLIRR